MLSCPIGDQLDQLRVLNLACTGSVKQQLCTRTTMWTLMLPSEVLNLPTADLCVSLTNLAAYWLPVRKKGRGGNLSSHTEWLVGSFRKGTKYI